MANKIQNAFIAFASQASSRSVSILASQSQNPPVCRVFYIRDTAKAVGRPPSLLVTMYPISSKGPLQVFALRPCVTPCLEAGTLECLGQLAGCAILDGTSRNHGPHLGYPHPPSFLARHGGRGSLDILSANGALRSSHRPLPPRHRRQRPRCYHRERLLDCRRHQRRRVGARQRPGTRGDRGTAGRGAGPSIAGIPAALDIEGMGVEGMSG